MKNVTPSTVVPAALAIAALLLVSGWLSSGPIRPLEARIPGLDRPLGAAPAANLPLKGKLVKLEGKAAELPGLWPGFRGEKLDGICHETLPLARKWPAGGPPLLWSLDLGEGYAGAAVRGGRVFVLDYDREGSADALRCFSLADGKEIWRLSYPVVVKRNHGMSRTTPAVTDTELVALGPKCDATCVDPATGTVRWMFDLVRKFKATVPQWYNGQCPLIDNGRAILAVGADALLVALDCKTGDVVWKSPNPNGWAMTHGSITPMEFAGRRMYVYCGKGGVAGVSVDDGKLLWDTSDWKIAIATVPSPVILPGGRIFLSGGYNSGALILQLAVERDQIRARTLRRIKPGEFGSTQQTPILYENHLYGVREKDRELVCLDLDGHVVWTSGPQHRFGIGPYLIADGLIYVLDDNGKLTLAEAAPGGYRQLDQAQVLDGHDAWGPMALVGGRLILRDLVRMVCVDVAKK
jgi:outer membrane protein assembly factor BamB